MTIFFTADQHYGHGRIKEDGERTGALRFGQRKYFGSVEEMDETLIERHNAFVRPQDTVYYLGDLSFHNNEQTVMILSRLYGRKHWVTGNHDKSLLKSAAVRGFFETIERLVDTKFGHQHATLCHFPLLTWDRAHYGSWMLHGHSHGSCWYPHPNNRILDVGVDTHNFMPWSYEEVEAHMQLRGYKSVDHHEGKQNGS